MSSQTVLGVIGGSGVYQMEGVDIIEEHSIKTPFGEPSDKVLEAEIAGRRVYFLPRHGRGHRFTPTEVPYQANIFALKTFGVTHLMAVSAVGIMRDDIEPGHMVVPDQIFDRTKGIRPSSFFGDGIVGHVTFADPFSEEMRQLIISSAKAQEAKLFTGGTYICMEGPQFSTRAESEFYRSTVQPSVIGMTALPEAKLAREAEMCYGMLALATDYDCWKEDAEDVSVTAVVEVLKKNSAMANRIIGEVAKQLPVSSEAPELKAAEYAIMTNREMIPEKRRQELEPLFGKYLGN